MESATVSSPPVPCQCLRDARDQRLGTAVREAADHAEAALARMMSFQGSPAGPGGRPRRRPGLGPALLMQAGHWLSLDEATQLPRALALLDRAEPCARTPRRASRPT
jgi:hypothetical protein